MVKHDEPARGSKGKNGKRELSVPAVIAPDANAPTIVTKRGSFDLEDPVLPAWVEEAALKSGGYPHDKLMKGKHYEEELRLLQVELVKVQRHVADKGLRLVALFEGRDAAGKGGAILAIRENMNPRTARAVALTKPTETERGQWYFQRYVGQLPTAGEIVLFDRSWYNRAGVEPVMGFCTASEAREFLIQAPTFEKMLVDSGIVLFKFWLEIGREMQLKQFHQRRHNPLKTWKLSPIDYAAINKWDDYTKARDEMLAHCNKMGTPWTVILANDKRRARLEIIRHMLAAIDYRGKDRKIVGRADKSIIDGPRLLKA